MSEEKESKMVNVSARITKETHEKVTAFLKQHSSHRKVSVADLINATLEIPEDVMKKALTKVLRGKNQTRRKRSEIGKKITNLSPEALARVQAIIDEESDDE